MDTIVCLNLNKASKIFNHNYYISVCIICMCDFINCKAMKRQDKEQLEFICPADGKWPHEKLCGKYGNSSNSKAPFLLKYYSFTAGNFAVLVRSPAPIARSDFMQA